MEAIETIERDGYIGEIHLDECPENPREMFDYHGTRLVQLSDRYLAPSRDDRADWRYDLLVDAWQRTGPAYRWNGMSYGGWRHCVDLVERYARAFLGAVVVAWWDDPTSDSRIFGYVTRESAEGMTDPQTWLDAELREYVAWCLGDVYGYTVTAPDGEEIDSCWGYYGDTELPYIRACIDGAIGMHRAGVHVGRVETFKRLLVRA